MAKTQTSTPAPETPAAVVSKAFTAGSFNFKVSKGLPIPAAVPRTVKQPNELWFKDFFEGAEHNDSVFIPNSFWTAPKEQGGRGVAPEKATLGYIKGKIRDSFNTWKGKTAPAEDAADKTNPRDAHSILVFPRKEGDEMGEAGEKAPEDGVSLFFLTDEPATA